MSPPPRTTVIGPKFSGALFSRHPPKQRLSLSTKVHLYTPLTYRFLVWPFLYARVYCLSLPIRPFQGPLYTVMGPFYPRAPSPRSGGSEWPAPALHTGDEPKTEKLAVGTLGKVLVWMFSRLTIQTDIYYLSEDRRNVPFSSPRTYGCETMQSVTATGCRTIMSCIQRTTRGVNCFALRQQFHRVFVF